MLYRTFGELSVSSNPTAEVSNFDAYDVCPRRYPIPPSGSNSRHVGPVAIPVYLQSRFSQLFGLVSQIVQ
jgi:hypothetical protein